MTDEELVVAVAAVLERQRSVRARDWTEEENQAYKDSGGWSEGRDAVTRLRATEIIALVRAQW